MIIGAGAMKPKIQLMTAIALSLVFLGGCSMGLFSKKRTTDVEVVILFTANTNGELVPCG